MMRNRAVECTESTLDVIAPNVTGPAAVANTNAQVDALQLQNCKRTS